MQRCGAVVLLRGVLSCVLSFTSLLCAAVCCSLCCACSVLFRFVTLTVFFSPAILCSASSVLFLSFLTLTFSLPLLSGSRASPTSTAAFLTASALEGRVV